MGPLDRRDFLKLAGMAGVTAALGTSGYAVAAGPAEARRAGLRYPPPLRPGDTSPSPRPLPASAPIWSPGSPFCSRLPPNPGLRRASATASAAT